MDEAIHVARTKDEAAAKLEWIFAESVLAVSGRLGALARPGVVGAEQVEEIRFAKSGGLVYLAVFVDEQGEYYLGLLAEVAGVIRAAEPDSGKVRSLLPESLFSVAQLRDMLTAEDSTPVAQKNDDRGLVRPERAEPYGLAIDVGQCDGREGSGERHSSSFRFRVTGFNLNRFLALPSRPQPLWTSSTASLTRATAQRISSAVITAGGAISRWSPV